MAALCREFGVSRKTGYKLYRRYRDIGLEGLTDRSRRPYRQANWLPVQDPREATSARLRRAFHFPRERSAGGITSDLSERPYSDRH